MRNRKREQEVLGAAVRHMERIKGESLSVVDRPDRRERKRKAVDLIVRGASSTFAVEHTRLESFVEQIEDDRHLLDLLGPIQEMVSNSLPTPGKYVLVVRPRAVKGAKRKQEIQHALVDWIVDKAPALEIGSAATNPRHYVREVPPCVPFEATLYRWPGRSGGLRISRSVPEILEEKRLQRVRAALDAKCPKLCKAKEDGYVSVLVLESDDLALANHGFIAAAVREAAQMIGDGIPDEIYLVETEIEPWIVQVIKYGPTFHPDLSLPASLLED